MDHDGMRGRSLFVLAVALAVLLLAIRAAVTVRDSDIVDFRCFWEAGRLMREGRDPYDAATWASAVYTDPGRVPHCAGTFVYPGVTALMLAPLSLAPEPVALALWEALLLLATVVAVTLVARTRALGGARSLLVPVLWSQPLFSAVASGQFGPLLLLGFATLAFALERGGRWLASAAWILLLLKPHLTAIVLVGALFARTGRWRVVALAGGAVLAVASVAIVPAWPFEWVREALAQRLLADLGLSSLWTLAAAVELPPLIGGIAAFVLVAIGLALLPRRWPRPHEVLAILVAVTFVVTPYARPHDLDALALCWAVPLARFRTDAGVDRRWLYAVVFVIVVLPWALTLLTQFGVPLATYVLVSIASGALMVAAMRRPHTAT